MQSSRERALEHRRTIARRLGAELARHPEISAILVFGSVASGQVDERSDLDLFVVCRSAIPSIAERQTILTTLGSGWQMQDQMQDNPLFAYRDQDGVIEGVFVTLHYQTVSWIDQVLTDVIERGMLSTPQMSFRAYTLPALLKRGWLLQDQDGTVRRWREQIEPFPAQLQRNLLDHFIPLLHENVEELVANAERNLGPRVFLFRLNWAVDALIGVLFAVNETYDPADRRTERMILPTLNYVPSHFTARLTDVLEGPFDDQGARYRARVFAQLAQEAVQLAERR
jgi:predicted nucleotidyltransferase